MLKKKIEGAAAERISCSRRLDRLHGKSGALHPHPFIVSPASILTHSQEDQRDIIFILKISDPLVIIFLSGHKLKFIVRDLQNMTHTESIFHLLFRKIKGTPQRRS